MDLTPLMLDPNLLRTVAAAVDHTAATLGECRLDTPIADALPGSAVAGIDVEPIAARLAALSAQLRTWASAVRTVSTALETADLDVAAGVPRP